MSTTEPVEITYLNSEQTANLLGIKTTTLANWRSRGIGPVYIKVGGSRSPVLYRKSDIDEWLAMNIVNPSCSSAAITRIACELASRAPRMTEDDKRFLISFLAD